MRHVAVLRMRPFFHLHPFVLLLRHPVLLLTPTCFVTRSQAIEEWKAPAGVLALFCKQTIHDSETRQSAHVYPPRRVLPNLLALVQFWQFFYRIGKRDTDCEALERSRFSALFEFGCIWLPCVSIHRCPCPWHSCDGRVIGLVTACVMQTPICTNSAAFRKERTTALQLERSVHHHSCAFRKERAPSQLCI